MVNYTGTHIHNHICTEYLRESTYHYTHTNKQLMAYY